jgi:hypothetical protein
MLVATSLSAVGRTFDAPPPGSNNGRQLLMHESRFIRVSFGVGVGTGSSPHSNLSQLLFQ